MHVTLKIRPGKLTRFCELLGVLVPAIERHGWKLLAAFVNVIGRRYTVVDLWQLPDANSVGSVLEIVGQDASLADVVAEVDECVEEEVLQIMTKVPYSP
jgi:hypothetical protein